MGDSIRFYTFRVHWVLTEWESGEDVDKVSRGIVAAHSYGEAMDKICNRLPYAHKISIDEYDDINFMFLSKENYNLLLNTPYGLDDPKEYEDEL